MLPLTSAFHAMRAVFVPPISRHPHSFCILLRLLREAQKMDAAVNKLGALYDDLAKKKAELRVGVPSAAQREELLGCILQCSQGQLFDFSMGVCDERPFPSEAYQKVPDAIR